MASCVTEPIYEFDVVHLQSRYINTFRKAVNKIEKKIDYTLREVEEIANSEIQSFSIGKTYARKTFDSPFLDPQDENTFTKTGICNRWRHHKYTDYGKDGMVVVAIITDDVASRLGYDDAEECALDIEQELQERYFSRDNRSIHEEYHRGSVVQEPAEGYPIYITYAFSESRPSSPEPTTSQFVQNRPQQDTWRPAYEPIRSYSYFDQSYSQTPSYRQQQHSQLPLYHSSQAWPQSQGRPWNQYPSRPQTQGRTWNQYSQSNRFFPYHRPQVWSQYGQHTNCHYRQRYWS